MHENGWVHIGKEKEITDQIVHNVFPLITGGKVALNRLRPLLRFNATFPPILREKRYL